MSDEYLNQDNEEELEYYDGIDSDEDIDSDEEMELEEEYEDEDYEDAEYEDDDYEDDYEEVAAGDDEFEEISSEEVDRVISQLEELIESTESNNIRTHLEEAMNSIFYLVYDDNDLEDDDDDSPSEAA